MLTSPSRISSRLVFAVFLAASLAISAPAAFSKERIGLSLPLTGNASRLARQFLVGAELALKIYNHKNATANEIKIADDACDSEIAKLAAEELLAQKVSLVTGLICNVAAKAVASRLSDSKIPLLVAGARSERLIKDRAREHWNLWRLSPGDSDAAEFAGKVLAKDWIGKPYAIVDDGTVYGRNIADAFRAIMEENGLPPQFQDNFRPTQSTQARLVRRLRRAGITHVFIGASGEDVAMIARNAKELNIPLQIAGGEVLSILPYLPTDSNPPDGLLAIVEKSALEQNIPQNILTLFAEEKIEPEVHVLAGYQAMEVALQAIEPTNEETQKALSTRQFETILGPVSFTPDGKNTAEQYGLYVWRNNSFEQAIQ